MHIYVLLYVDDILPISPNSSDIVWLKNSLSAHYDVTDNGPVFHFLGIYMTRYVSELFLSQRAYIDSILSRYGFTDAKLVPTPFNDKEILMPNPGTADPHEVHRYEELVGSLIWLMIISISFCNLKTP